jgi:3-hydroxyacyl-CoA dehydrogenase
MQVLADEIENDPCMERAFVQRGGKMKYQIKKAVVIGAGTMGAAIACHLANVGVPVSLLDIVPNRLTPDEEKKNLTLGDPAVRNRIVKEGFDRAIKSRPANLFTSSTGDLITLGNLEDDFGVVSEADWIIEVIVENLDIKRTLMERLEAKRSPHTIISTNTSGIPVNSIATGRSKEFQQHFLGTHFFNPPRYLKLVEVIPTTETLPEVVQFISHFLEYRLGKGVVFAKDTPNFIGNRLFAGWSAFEMDYILNNSYTVEEIDAITGPTIGHPKTATFRLFDLVGMDVWAHVGSNLAPLIPHDKHALKYMASPQATKLVKTMVDNGWLGTKTKQGFYKEVRKEGKKEFWPLNLQTMEYEPPTKVRFESIGKVKDIEKLDERLKILMEADDRAAQYIQAMTYQSLAYSSEMIPEISDTPKPLDDAMRWGFGHEAGPFQIWDMLGVAETTEKMKSNGFAPAPWVDEMLASGITSFYKYESGSPIAVYFPAKREYLAILTPPEIINLNNQSLIMKNASASLWDIGDGVAYFDLHAKMNALDDDIFTLLQSSLDRVDHDFDGMVIGTQGEHFGAGANLFLVVMLAQSKEWAQLEGAVRRLQDINMRMRYFTKPIVMATAGLALGGAAEVLMHGSRVVSGAELYAGQVEIGPGVIPAGGGTKELLRRILNPPMHTNDAQALPYLQRIFELIGMAKVSTSAEEARQFGFLSQADRVVMNRDHLLAEGKREVLHMVASSYRPPLPEKIYAGGRDSLAALQVGIYMFKEGGYITEYESVIGQQLARVMTGGDISQPTWVSEQYILDLEREAFVSLCGQEKTQQRMWNLLQTGKVLRN